MTESVNLHLQNALHHVYINPLEQCNLHCAVCYTRKTTPVLSEDQILKFITKYAAFLTLESVTFCGGEVFLLPYVPHAVNSLTDRGLFVKIITNGTINRLRELQNPNAVNVIVSLDGLPAYHDTNRGAGMFQKSIDFLKNALCVGFHAEIFSVVTKQNYPHLKEFEAYVCDVLDHSISITYHPRKPLAYLALHPVSNINKHIHGFDFLNKREITQLMRNKKTFPPKELGCYQIALMSDGKIYGCCEGIRPIGTIHDDIQTLVENLTNRVNIWDSASRSTNCLGCSEPEFVCGLQKHLS